MSTKFKKVFGMVLVCAMLLSAVAVLSACKPKEDEKDPMTYTYNTYLVDFPSTWNNHRYETATDGEFLGYTEPGFFRFDYNENEDGYVIVPEMATKEPEDVSADYVGQFGIEEGDTAKAWKVTIHDNVKWEDGTPIKAQDFVDSLKLLLNPEANNHRADSAYSGSLVISGAKEYFYQGRELELADNDLYAGYAIADLVLGEDGKYKTEQGTQVYVGLNAGMEWLSGNSLADYVGAYGAKYFDTEAYAALAALADEDGMVELTSESLVHLQGTISNNPAWGETAEDACHYIIYDYTYPEIGFETVGFKAVSDTELIFFLESELSGFYLLYNLSGTWLVNTALYEECMTVDEDGIYNNTYGTSVETYMSYGPYKLTQYQKDKIAVLERNEHWYGYTLDENEGLYQTDKIVYDCYKDSETAFMAFLQGKLDAKGLDAKHVGDYTTSEHIYYTDGASTFFMALNPDLAALTKNQESAGENINKTILTIKEFRMALSFALDRQAFINACDPSGSPAFAVFNNLIIYDPETGSPYRTTDEAKQAMVEFWGVADDIGPGKLYPDIDTAIKGITGYNLDEGKRLFDIAYEKAIEAGLMDEDDKVQICIGLPNDTSVFYKEGYNILENVYTEAVKGTQLEGKLEFTKNATLGNGYADALRDNVVDLLFGVGWQGAALDPYYLMTAYLYPNYQYDPSWKTEEETLDITLSDGKTYRATLIDWSDAMNGAEVSITEVLPDGSLATKPIAYSCGLNDGKPEERVHLLAMLEGAILNNYTMIPLDNESSAALKGMQISYHTEEYVYGVGRGGIKYMTYNYTDMQWDKYVKSQNGQLNYK